MIYHRHTGIVCNDLALQKDFYVRVLGLTVFQKKKLEKGSFIEEILNCKGVEVETIKLGYESETIIELLKFNNKDFESTPKILFLQGITHIALSVNYIDVLYHKLIKNGATVLSQPQMNEEKTCKVMFCKDYEGNYLELVEEI